MKTRRKKNQKKQRKKIKTTHSRYKLTEINKSKVKKTDRILNTSLYRRIKLLTQLSSKSTR